MYMRIMWCVCQPQKYHFYCNEKRKMKNMHTCHKHIMSILNRTCLTFMWHSSCHTSSMFVFAFTFDIVCGIECCTAFSLLHQVILYVALFYLIKNLNLLNLMAIQLWFSFPLWFFHYTNSVEMQTRLCCSINAIHAQNLRFWLSFEEKFRYELSKCCIELHGVWISNSTIFSNK